MLNIVSHQEMQIKTIVRYHFTPTRIAIRKKIRADVAKDVEKLETLIHWRECKMVHYALEHNLAVPQKAKCRVSV